MNAKNLIGHQLWPKRTPDSVRDSVLMNVVVAAWLTVSSIQVAIWVLMCVIGAQFAYPFWIWGTAGGAVVIAGLGWIVHESRSR